MRRYDVDVTASVEINVNDDNAILRCTENQDENGVPQPDVKGGRGWRNVLYDLKTESDVIDMWASNALRNGVEDASALDGWGDLERGVVTMRVYDVEVDSFITDEAEAGPLPGTED